jgi:hypothetical protein
MFSVVLHELRPIAVFPILFKQFQSKIIARFEMLKTHGNDVDWYLHSRLKIKNSRTDRTSAGVPRLTPQALLNSPRCDRDAANFNELAEKVK